jgi:hypothetical protein
MWTRRKVVSRAALLTGGVLLGCGAGSAAAHPATAAEEPEIYDREAWGARNPRAKAEVLDRAPDHIVVHHTATENTSATSRGRAFSLSQGIQNWHMDNNGWWDTGQHLTISRGGYIMEGRAGSLPSIRRKRHVIGAHTANHNSSTLGIENEGTYGTVQPPRELMEALTDTLVWLCSVYALDPHEAIVGHRDFNATACPGDELYALLPMLRNRVWARMVAAERHLELLGQGPRRDIAPPARSEAPEAHRNGPYYHGPALGEEDPQPG